MRSVMCLWLIEYYCLPSRHNKMGPMSVSTTMPLCVCHQAFPGGELIMLNINYTHSLATSNCLTLLKENNSYKILLFCS